MADIRHRMVVEEVGASDNPPVDTPPVTEEIKEKVEELKDIEKHLEEDIKDSAEVTEELEEAVEKSEATVEEKPEEFVAPRQAPSFNPLLIILPGLLLLGALMGGIIFYQKNMNKVEADESPTPVASIKPQPTQTPAASVSLTKYSINVLNGSGIAGEAGKVKTLVETDGFKVGKTGNAPTYDYKKTVIKAKATVEKEYLDTLSKALSKNYTLDTNQTLSSTSSDDVQIIVGSTKATN